MPPVKPLVVSLLAAVLVAGCGHGENTRLFITNHTAATWYLKVKSSMITYVVKVSPGADGMAIAWAGGSKVPVHLLDQNCTEVGTFVAMADGTYAVTGVPDLSARIEDKAPGYAIGWASGTDYTTQCGGQMWTD